MSTLDLGVPEAYLPIQEEEEGKSNPTSPEKNGGGSSAEKEARRQYKQHIDDLGRSPYYETSIVLGEMAVCLTPQVGSLIKSSLPETSRFHTHTSPHTNNRRCPIV